MGPRRWPQLDGSDAAADEANRLEGKVTIHNAFPDRPVQTMKLNYYSETDSLYIIFRSRPASKAGRFSRVSWLTYDADGNLVRIDIDDAKRRRAGERPSRWT